MINPLTSRHGVVSAPANEGVIPIATVESVSCIAAMQSVITITTLEGAADGSTGFNDIISRASSDVITSAKATNRMTAWVFQSDRI